MAVQPQRNRKPPHFDLTILEPLDELRQAMVREALAARAVDRAMPGSPQLVIAKRTLADCRAGVDRARMLFNESLYALVAAQVES